MRLPDRHSPRDLAPDIERPWRHEFTALDARLVVMEPTEGSTHRVGGRDDWPFGRDRAVRVVAVKPPSRSSLDALCGRPITVGRRDGKLVTTSVGPGDLRIGADILAARREHERNAAAVRTSHVPLVVSGALHLAALIMLIPVPRSPIALAPEAQQRQVDMVFVQQPQTTRGAPPVTPDTAAKLDTKTAALASPLPPARTPDQSAAPPATPAPPSGSAAPHWESSMLDEPGDAPNDASAYAATSDDLRPTRPNSAYRNMPPRYPADAARHGQRGVVDLIVHVKPDGRAGEVEIAGSSGVASLDHSAVEALSKWHFQPQMSGTVPVPSQFRIAVHYDGSGP